MKFELLSLQSAEKCWSRQEICFLAATKLAVIILWLIGDFFLRRKERRAGRLSTQTSSVSSTTTNISGSSSSSSSSLYPQDEIGAQMANRLQGLKVRGFRLQVSFYRKGRLAVFKLHRHAYMHANAHQLEGDTWGECLRLVIWWVEMLPWSDNWRRLTEKHVLWARGT